MEGTILFNQKDPEDFKNEIIKGIRKELKLLKQDFQPRDVEEFLTREETARKIKIDKSTLWAWTKKGIIKSYGIGNRVYYKASEIEAALQPLNH